MKYEGPLYGKMGRRYIPLRQTSEDVDRMEYENKVMSEKLFSLIGLFVIPPEINPLRPPAAFPSHSVPFEFNQMGPVHTSFKFDQPTQP